ncbi:MAG: HlyD family secretion protein [Cellulomonas sp.]|nr:biotin/lipoyl-binding protein [Cellulomonas sp.]MCR6648444.1 HlyD family secretion protein [Cellulomonas sp.]
MTDRRGRQRRRVLGVVAGATALCVAGGGVALALAGSDATRYRTATAELGSVAQQVALTGTVASATRRDVAFSVGGTVGSVEVAVGDEVAPGDVLATIDDTDLQQDVDDATATLADAQQRLEDDLESQTTSTSTASTSSTGVSTTSASTTSASTTSATTTSSAASGSPTSGAGEVGGVVPRPSSSRRVRPRRRLPDRATPATPARTSCPPRCRPRSTTSRRRRRTC